MIRTKSTSKPWWAMTGSNRRPSRCKRLTCLQHIDFVGRRNAKEGRFWHEVRKTTQKQLRKLGYAVMLASLSIYMSAYAAESIDIETGKPIQYQEYVTAIQGKKLIISKLKAENAALKREIEKLRERCR